MIMGRQKSYLPTVAAHQKWCGVKAAILSFFL